MMPNTRQNPLATAERSRIFLTFELLAQLARRFSNEDYRSWFPGLGVERLAHLT